MELGVSEMGGNEPKRWLGHDENLMLINQIKYFIKKKTHIFSILWWKLYDSDTDWPPHVSQVKEAWSECFSHREIVRGG
jgi:hypothetical protein